jgi:crossover junction endodeoxyribonuclease RuvC
MLSWVVGIDPGVLGAFAFLGNNGEIEIFDTPNACSAGKKIQIDEDPVCRLFDERSKDIVCAWIEQTWARPGEGVVNAATQVGNYQFLRGVLRANFIPVQAVSPQRWKREMKVDKGKDASRVRASALLPTHSTLWPLKKHNGRTDALLIALYGVRQTGGFIERYVHSPSKIGEPA